MEILLTPDQESTLWSHLQVIVTDKGENVLYMPYYLIDKGNGLYDKLRFDQLSEEIKDKLLANQGIKLPTE